MAQVPGECVEAGLGRDRRRCRGTEERLALGVAPTLVWGYAPGGDKELRADPTLLVLGSRNSSNSNRLVDVARAAGVSGHLIDDETEIDERWLDGVRTVGISSGASAPERLVARLCDWFRDRGVERIEPFRMVEEDVTFKLPVELRRELSLADAQQ